jgi:hypothetical protein
LVTRDKQECKNEKEQDLESKRKKKGPAKVMEIYKDGMDSKRW